MDGNGFTGFNPEMLQTEVKDFYEFGMNIAKNLNNASGGFISALRASWFSPKAVAFTDKLYDIDRCIYNLKVAYSNVASQIIEAYNIHANANNLPTLSNEYETAPYQLEGQEFGEIVMLAQSSDGKVGMDRQKVVEAKDKFAAAVNQAMGDVFASYQTPSFYDETGSQVTSFISSVNDMKSRLQSTFDDLTKNLDKYITEEVDLSQSAATSAVNTLNGSTSGTNANGASEKNVFNTTRGA